MLLYHGTHRSLVPTILGEGLVPRVGRFVRAKHGEGLKDGTPHPPVVFACDDDHMYKAWNAIGYLAMRIGEVSERQAYQPPAVHQHGALLVIDNTAGLFQCRFPSEFDGEEETPFVPGYGHVEPGDFIAETMVPVQRVLEGDEMVEFLIRHQAYNEGTASTGRSR